MAAEAQFGSGALDGVAHGSAAVAGKVVHHYDVAGLEGGHQHLFDVGEEGGAMHGTVEHHGSGHTAQPQGTNEGCGLPVPMRHRGAATLSARSAAASSRHLGGRACFVDEDQPLGLEIGLCLDPGLPAAEHVSPLLLAGVRGFF